MSNVRPDPVTALKIQPAVNTAGYNEILAIKEKKRKTEQKRLIAKSTAMDYALDILHKGDGTMTNRKLQLPYRTYVWKGGETKDANGNPIVDANGNPVPWCFAYGEEEWLAGKLWEKTLKEAARYQRGKPEPGTTDPRTGCQ